MSDCDRIQKRESWKHKVTAVTQRLSDTSEVSKKLTVNATAMRLHVASKNFFIIFAVWYATWTAIKYGRGRTKYKDGLFYGDNLISRLNRRKPYSVIGIILCPVSNGKQRMTPPSLWSSQESWKTASDNKSDRYLISQKSQAGDNRNQQPYRHWCLS